MNPTFPSDGFPRCEDEAKPWETFAGTPPRIPVGDWVTSMLIRPKPQVIPTDVISSTTD